MKPLYRKGQIFLAVKRLAHKIETEFPGKHPVLVGVLKGSFIFIADLAREIRIPYEIDFIRASGGVVTGDMSIDPQGRHLIVVEDIVDGGETMNALGRYLEKLNPASISFCALLRRKGSAFKNYGLEVDEGFVVGYGMDHAEKYRGLPDLWTL